MPDNKPMGVVVSDIVEMYEQQQAIEQPYHFANIYKKLLSFENTRWDIHYQFLNNPI